jgi:DDE_Tnp_1-associated
MICLTSDSPARVVYPLNEVLLLALLATLAGAETFTDIVRFGDKKRTLLRRFRPFRDGTPPHDRIGGIFATKRTTYSVFRLAARRTGLCAGYPWLDPRR